MLCRHLLIRNNEAAIKQQKAEKCIIVACQAIIFLSTLLLLTTLTRAIQMLFCLSVAATYPLLFFVMAGCHLQHDNGLLGGWLFPTMNDCDIVLCIECPSGVKQRQDRHNSVGNKAMDWATVEVAD
jgi:hypothetical protein